MKGGPASNWSWEERERYAYITGSPLAPLFHVIHVTIPERKLEEEDFKKLEMERDDLVEEVNALRRDNKLLFAAGARAMHTSGDKRLQEIEALCVLTP